MFDIDYTGTWYTIFVFESSLLNFGTDFTRHSRQKTKLNLLEVYHSAMGHAPILILRKFNKNYAPGNKEGLLSLNNRTYRSFSILARVHSSSYPPCSFNMAVWITWPTGTSTSLAERRCKKSRHEPESFDWKEQDGKVKVIAAFTFALKIKETLQWCRWEMC